MSLNSFFNSAKPVRVPVEAVALVIMMISLQSIASTGPSWTNQQNWVGNASAAAAPAHERKKALSSDRSKISPFAPDSNNVALDVGQVFLMGDLGKYSDAIGSQLHYTYGVSDLFGFDSSLGYSEHSDGRFSMLSLLTGLRTNLSWYDRVVPYMVFGLGFYKPSFQQIANGEVSSISPVLFGVHLGPGVDLQLSKQLYFGAALTFHDAFGTTRIQADGTPLSVGGTFTSFLLHAGVTF